MTKYRPQLDFIITEAMLSFAADMLKASFCDKTALLAYNDAVKHQEDKLYWTNDRDFYFIEETVDKFIDRLKQFNFSNGASAAIVIDAVLENINTAKTDALRSFWDESGYGEALGAIYDLVGTRYIEILNLARCATIGSSKQGGAAFRS